MKAIIIVLFCLLAGIHTLRGQEGQLVLTNKKNEKRSTIEEGKFVKVYKSKESYVSGELNLVDFSTIAVGSDTIALADIELIVAKTSGTRKGGTIALAAGVLTLAGGLAILANSNEDSSDDFFPVGKIAGIAMIVVGATATVSGTGNLTFGHNYGKERWAYSIRTPMDFKK